MGEEFDTFMGIGQAVPLNLTKTDKDVDWRQIDSPLCKAGGIMSRCARLNHFMANLSGWLQMSKEKEPLIQSLPIRLGLFYRENANPGSQLQNQPIRVNLKSDFIPSFRSSPS